MKIHSTLSFKSKLLLFALCISLIPIAIITIVYYINARSALQHQILNQLKAVTESKKINLLFFMEIKEARTIAFSSDGLIKNAFQKIIRGKTLQQGTITRLNEYLLKNNLPQHRHLVGIVIADEYGKIISSTHEGFIGIDISDQDIFIQGIHKKFGEVYVSQPRYSPILGLNSIAISAPITFSNNTDARGVIVNIYRLAALNEITTNRIGMGETGEVYLVDKNKIMLTESRFTEKTSLTQIVDTEAVRRFIQDGKETVGIYKDYRGIPIVGTSVYIPEYQWILLAEIDKGEAFAPLKMLGITALILGVASMAAATGIGIIFAVSASRPIKDLTCATEKFAHGELHYRVKVNRNDEIGILARSFNAMAGRLATVDALSKEIAERKRVEKQLKRYTAELNRSNEELQNFAYVASHDLQEPLRMISSYLQLLERRYKDKLDKDACEFIAYAVDGASRLQNLINGLLEYSRVDTRGKHFGPADCEIILKRVLSHLKITIEESNATVTHDPLPVVLADDTQIPQVFQNLISNAIKFRGEEPPRIHISARPEGNEWIFSVRDNGIGIEPEYKERIFTIFKRLHGREYPGVGLGLSICRKIILRHGGRMWVESEYGKGTTFYFTLPIKGETHTYEQRKEYETY
ncbi:MAG: HAMP domain-containing protein [wastewater metagenome]|nr:HAMP domain-containing protein [Candidatus Loosdrechtia aerotolerans]